MRTKNEANARALADATAEGMKGWPPSDREHFFSQLRGHFCFDCGSAEPKGPAIIRCQCMNDS